MWIRLLIIGTMLAAPGIAGAETPRYTPEFLGAAIPGRMNIHAEIIGTMTVGTASRAVVLRHAETPALLPLPAGMSSSSAADINDNGDVVGRVGPFSSTDYQGVAAAWQPDGTGGYSVRLLGALPGQYMGAATAVNDRGDVVGYSFNGTFRYPVWFRAPGDVVDLSAMGIFDPVDINEGRVLVDHSYTAKRLDLDTMIAEDLGVPPPGSMHYRSTWAMAINESGHVAGSAILATSTSCDRQAARYADGEGWRVFSICGPNNGATDINDAGDLMMRIGITPFVRFEGQGTFAVESLIVNDLGHWYAVSGAAGWINNGRIMVIYATNPATDQTGALLLIPEARTTVAATEAGAPESGRTMYPDPNPFHRETMIRFQLPRSTAINLAIYDLGGRRVRTLVAGALRAAGWHQVGWDGRDDAGVDAASGVYYGRLEAGDVIRTERLVLAR